jgi:hypothetical protein
MLDGAALGTLIIGLDSARKASEWSDAPVRPAARRSRSTPTTYRIKLANALRFAADRLDRQPSETVGSSGSAA